ncbi:MAG: hypothetical protein H5T50_06855 [Nitrososphaeria archaeon]|nr:hypothetical protein [Nitrososphaeria archaeon]
MKKVDLKRIVKRKVKGTVDRPELLDEACKPISGFEEAYSELRNERGKMK